MNSLKWVIMVGTTGHEHSFPIDRDRSTLSLKIEDAQVFDNLDDCMKQIIEWNREDLAKEVNVDVLINYPYVAVLHPDSVINFVRDQLVEKYDDIPF